MKGFKKIAIKCMAFLSLFSVGAGLVGQSFAEAKGLTPSSQAVKSNISKVDALVDSNIEQYFDESVVQSLPGSVQENQVISVIVELKGDSVMDAFKAQSTVDTVSNYVNTSEAKLRAAQIEKEQNSWIYNLNKSGISYTLGERYDTVLNGFEIEIRAKDFEKVNEFFGRSATLTVGDEYAPALAEPVTNYVDVYDTGIFDTSRSTYQGDGVVVAVLDTGLDYTHTAFSAEEFAKRTNERAFTLSDVSGKVDKTVAAKFSKGLTGEDVYVNAKVPYAYDYADKDPDVLPINSDHGTHVAGIIAGHDQEITGVAPNAQLAIMKVFSDASQGAKDSWILSALEDCVALGVDVINMSLGSAGGFTREVDKVNKNNVYDRIREAGISLIVAAGNDSNATRGSSKNGSNGLTSNPDSGPVGTPSTYEASLAVAAVDGVKTPYLRWNDDIIYFKEASTSDSETRHFVDEILAEVGADSYEFEYVTIPGVGRSADYPEDKSFYEGKIVLVKRGQTTFEDKVRVALVEKGAAGIIIYNNISGDISMSIGESTGRGGVCSISQDDGEKLAAQGSGTIKVSKGQLAGPFMSDFSSWGPTSDLKIKPEITAHGGEIYSAVPGQAYDRLSGTSMAAPNQAGAAALIRQYVKYSEVFGASEEMESKPVEVTKLVNQLMMSTTDIVLNKNGVAYSVRKQGAGLVNIMNAYTSASYVSTFKKGTDAEGNETLVEMDKTKFELGDDKERTGVYEMTFAINNISNASATYELGAMVMTEGVSSTYTSHGDTTVTQEGYVLNGAKMSILSVTGAEGQNGMNVTVGAKKSAKITVRITLSDEDKAYMEKSFEYGMYVEGYITMKAVSGTTVDMNVPMLAFYGDWTEAPIFDEEYYDTHKDEINAGLDAEDKLMEDAYATRVYGGLYSEYIGTLGTYYFDQNPAATQIAADKDKISLSNQEGETGTLNSIYSIAAGLLRNVKEWTLTIVEETTGKVIYTKTGHNQRKCISQGSAIYASNMDIDFSVLEHNLKNNTKYNVKVETYIDYGTKEEQNNARNVFEFPLYIDFEAPTLTNVSYRTVYDKTTKKTQLFADVSVYDNHYAMAMQVGQIVENKDPLTSSNYKLETFGKYITPVYSSYNSTSVVEIELTDYVQRIKESCGPQAGYPNDGTVVEYNNNSFVINCYDYAMNSALYQVRLPDEVLAMYFDIEEEELRLSPNETKDLTQILKVFPAESWLQVLDFETSDSEVVDIINQTVIAKKSGEATVTAIGYDKEGNKKTAELKVVVLAEGDEGYNGSYSIPEINKFALTGYTVNKAYYSTTSAEREIGLTGSTQSFGNSVSLSMFPSESVTLRYELDSYFADRTTVTYTVGNSDIATVDENGTIVAQSEGTTIVSVDVLFDGQSTFYSGRVAITVKDPYTANSIYLMSYKGLGGVVEIPADRGFTQIYSYAFSNYQYVEKDLKAGDVIDEEDPYNIKQQYLGEDTITKVIIPEGITHIQEYAFAGLTALEEVVLPKSLINIGLKAFYNCTKLKTINLENVKFINGSAFENCILEEIKLDSINAIGDYSFKNCRLNYVVLPKSSQSLGVGAFTNNKYLTSIEFKAPKMKIGSSAFVGCNSLVNISINAAVIASYAFSDCTNLATVKLGADVAVIGEYAFAGTSVSKFAFITTNDNFEVKENGSFLYKKGTGELVLAAPTYAGTDGVVTLSNDTTSIATGAFAGNKAIKSVTANGVESVGVHAFAGCTKLASVTMSSLTTIGDNAFEKTALKATPDLSNVTSIGAHAFANTNLETVTIADETKVGEYAFAYNEALHTVNVGNNVELGKGAFYSEVADNTYAERSDKKYYTAYDYEVKDEEGNVREVYTYYRYNFNKVDTSALVNLTIGDNVIIGEAAFQGNVKLSEVTLGEGVSIGNYAFYNAAQLATIDLSKVVKVGAYAFSGTNTPDYWEWNDKWQYAYELVMVDDILTAIDYVYTTIAPMLTSIDLSAVKELGEGAFAYNLQLTSVTLGDELSAITLGEDEETVEAGKLAMAAFIGCEALENVVLPASVTAIGDYAFYHSGLKTIALDNVATVGKYAFANTQLTNVKVKENARLEDGAFAYCYDLATVENLDKVNYIGAMTFVNAALKEANLANVTEIGDFAFGSVPLEKVSLGENLTTLGENPFASTKLTTFGKEENVTFNGQVVKTTLNENYTIGESKTVQIIDGVLYQRTEKGDLELVSYPTEKDSYTYEVVNGTVRISARAFMDAPLMSVTIAATVKAIGDKAFYGCENLNTVIFLGYEAPRLEEEYDTTYLSYANMPHTGYISEYKGLGIVPYYMWSVTYSFSNFYFGANFVDHIGHLEDNKLVMVRPVNGQHYDTFIYEQYFPMVVDGSYAAMDDTLKVIEMIAALPDAANVTLADKDAIEAARAAYNNLPNEAQKSLVDTTRLEAAENILSSYLDQDQPSEDDGDTDEEKKGLPVWAIVLISVGGTLVLCAGAFVGFLMWKKYAAAKAEAEVAPQEETAEEKTEEAAEETAEEAVEETAKDVQEPVENAEK